MPSTNKLCLIDLPWEDIICRKILPDLHLKDLFNLRSTASTYKTLVDLHLVKLKQVDLERNKINNVGLQVCIIKTNNSCSRVIVDVSSS